MKLKEIKTEETNSFTAILMIATILSTVFILRKRKRK
ncbi:MAG: LPXTG cell wall anchor domain-containing protein [Candidatus Heimdallarchaeota archaeon]|nr:LPXTG cell wall anchor domain-containing protein [Candidatus Heimdallarchaeota archaeon]MCK4769753.1 LPXTG cell wall anchor domain-containing protein [Candidatus Heimdallarchaeota archaeon]